MARRHETGDAWTDGMSICARHPEGSPRGVMLPPEEAARVEKENERMERVMERYGGPLGYGGYEPLDKAGNAYRRRRGYGPSDY